MTSDTVKTCRACGIPNKANWHVRLRLGRGVVGPGTETTYTDVYVCNEHLTNDTRSMLNWDSTGWAILAVKKTQLR